MASESRQYEIILLGATGYTGRLCAEHIMKHLPTDLRWAVAGRNSQKLSSVAQELRSINSDRIQPEIEVAELNPADLDGLAKKSRLLITTVGPYHKYGTPVVEACAKNGTHYIDCTAETPWVRDMIEKYHETARSNRAIIIPQCGINVCADVITWLLVTYVRETLSVGVTEVINSLQEIDSKPSGGTLSTVLTLFESYSVSQMASALKPFALSPIPAPSTSIHVSSAPSLATRLLGVRTVPGLGLMTTGAQSAADAAMVYRSWGLLDEGRYYGPRFRYSEWLRTRNALVGALLHYGLMLGSLLLLFPPVRWALKRVVVQPGEGPERGSAQNDRLTFRAIAMADHPAPEDPKRAIATFHYTGGAYNLTGLLMAEAAMVILRGGGPEEVEAKRLGGGILTPATLGREYVERLRRVGVRLEVEMMVQ